MPDTCETVKIESKAAPGGFVVINASDFDPAKHRKLNGEEQDDKPRKGKKD